jgi:uncharacterized RDD family membrane protein YckC
VAVVTGEAVVLDVPCARFPSRLLALLIDAAIEAVVLGILAATMAAAGGQLDTAARAAVSLATGILVIVGYPATLETLSRGRSPGKIALGLRVVSDNGGPERFRQALVRALAAVVEIWLLSGAPALISSLLSAKGKRLGDLFAGTFVIQERLPARRGLPAALSVVPPPLAGWAGSLELSGLTEQTAETAGSYLRRCYELTPAARDEFGQRIAAAVAAQVSPPPPPGAPTAAYLSAVLAVRREREQARLAAAGAAAHPAAVVPAARASPDGAADSAAAADPGGTVNPAIMGHPDRRVSPSASSGNPAGLAPPDPGEFMPPG